MKSHAQASPDAPGEGLSHLAASLAAVRPFPAVVLSIRKAVGDPRQSVLDIGRLVEGDVGVSANLLRVANAPACGLAQRCNSVRHAVSLLGLRRVSELVTSAAALALLETAQQSAPFAATHAIAVAGVARLLAPITGVSPDEAFTAGLLHDVGALLLLQSGDTFYEGLVDQCDGGEEPSIADEQTLLGFDHAALGAEVLRQWNLPAPLPQIVALHHDWEGAIAVGGAACLMVALVRVADILVPELGRTAEPSLEQAQRLATDPAFAYLGLQGEELFKLWGGLRRACDKNDGVGDDTPAPSVREATPRRVAPLPVPPPSSRAQIATPAPSPMSSPWLWGGVLVVATVGLVFAFLG